MPTIQTCGSRSIVGERIGDLASIENDRLSIHSGLPTIRAHCCFYSSWPDLLGRLVYGYGLCSRNLLLVRCRKLHRPEVEGQQVDGAGEGERHLIVLLVHRCAGVNADVEGLVSRGSVALARFSQLWICTRMGMGRKEASVHSDFLRNSRRPLGEESL